MSDEDPYKRWREAAATGEPIVRFVLEVPIRISTSPEGAVQFDAPLPIHGSEQVGIQRVIVAVSAETLRAALEELEKRPGASIELSAKRSAH